MYTKIKQNRGGTCVCTIYIELIVYTYVSQGSQNRNLAWEVQYTFGIGKKYLPPWYTGTHM